MSYISKVNLNGTEYDIKDTEGRSLTAAAEENIASLSASTNGSMHYFTGNSIQSVAGTFWFDHKSGIDVSELPTMENQTWDEYDWTGIQIGAADGTDRTQYIWQGAREFRRYEDNSVGSETWTADSWYACGFRSNSPAVGSGTNPVYLSNRTLSASESDVGANNRPVYMNGGTITQCVQNGMTAIGYGAVANYTGATAYGNAAVAGNYYAVAAGQYASATGNYSIAVGRNSTAANNCDIAIGYNSTANNTFGIAMGHSSAASGSNSIAMGCSSAASGIYSVAMSHSSAASGAHSIAMGRSSAASGNGDVCVGYNSTAQDGGAVVMGVNCFASNFSVGIGNAANAAGPLSIAMGLSVNATASAISVGSYSNATGNGATALGHRSNSTAANSTAVGRAAVASGSTAVAVGYISNAAGAGATAVGGNGTTATYYATALGYKASASGNSAVAVGNGTEAVFHAVAIGYYASATANESTALGANAACANANGMQLGSSSSLSSLTCKVSLTTTSDIRDKADVEELPDGATEFLKAVTAIRYVFNGRELYIPEEEDQTEEDKENLAKYGMCAYDTEAWEAGTKKGSRKRVGISAQAIQAALEEVYGDSGYINLVNDNLYDFDQDTIPDGVESKLAVNYEGFVPVLVKAFQELEARVTALEEATA